jgi:hypothetical protein
METVTVLRTFNPAEADLISSMLNAAGLHSEVIHATAALTMDGYAMTAGGVLVQVPEVEAEEARQLIQTPGTAPA